MTKPRCPYCNAQGLEHLKIRPLIGPVAVVYCGQCGAIYNVITYKDTPQKESQKPDPQPAKATETASNVTGQAVSQPENNLPDYDLPKSLNVVAEIGQADLLKKIPYSPEKMANRAKAAGLGRGTQYLHFAVDNGPPVCLQHKQDMITVTIPPGYQNSGIVVWVCPNRDCYQWELADEDYQRH